MLYKLPLRSLSYAQAQPETCQLPVAASPVSSDRADLQVQYGLPLTILSYEELYGWTMDQIVAQIGTRGNCTFCGVFRRQALDRGAWKLQATKVATGASCVHVPAAPSNLSTEP